MSSLVVTAAPTRFGTAAGGMLARLRGWCRPVNPNVAWTIGPDGLPCAQWMWADDAVDQG